MRRQLPKNLNRIIKQRLNTDKKIIRRNTKSSVKNSATPTPQESQDSSTVQLTSADEKTTEESSKTSVIEPSDVTVDIEPKKPKVAVCCCGFAPRSIKYCHRSIQENVVDVLESEFDVDVYLYSFLSKEGRIQSSNSEEFDTEINNNDIMLLKTKKTWTAYQEDYTKVVKQYLTKANLNLPDLVKINYIRTLIMESNSFSQINDEGIEYDAYVYLQPDMFIAKPISCSEVSNVMRNEKVLYTCNFNDWSGYGTGFYIGTKTTIEILTKQLNYIAKVNNRQPEIILKKTCNQNNIDRCASKMFHFKIRANGKPNVYYQLLKKYTTPEEHKWVLKNMPMNNTVLKNTRTNGHAKYSAATTDSIIEPRRRSKHRKHGKHARKSC